MSHTTTARPESSTFSWFFWTESATPALYTLSLHDALPILGAALLEAVTPRPPGKEVFGCAFHHDARRRHDAPRSEEHTSELQSHSELVCRLLLEKKNARTQSGGDVHWPQVASRWRRTPSGK